MTARFASYLALLLIWIPAAMQAQEAVDIQFGELYGTDRDTTVVGGSGTIAPLITGQTFTWLCLDMDADSTAGEFLNMNVSTDSSSLASGIWGDTILSTATRESIANAIANMYYSFEMDLLADTTSDGTNNQPWSAFQQATWYFTEGYVDGVWSGVIDSTVVSDLIAWDGGGYLMQASTNSWLDSFLNASTNDAASAGKPSLYFASQDNTSDFQAVVIIPVPEPGSALMVGIFGLLGLIRRRR